MEESACNVLFTNPKSRAQQWQQLHMEMEGKKDNRHIYCKVNATIGERRYKGQKKGGGQYTEREKKKTA